MSASVSPDAREARVNLGLQQLWYPVLASWQLGREPRGIQRLGQHIAVWRDDAGGVRAIEDRCPHRGARLSMGCSRGDKLACWYHGVEVDAGGVVTDVPATDQSAMRGKKILRSYRAEEAHGAIFLWFGEGEPPPLRLPEQLTSDEFSGFLCTAVWRCNYRYAHDNLMAPICMRFLIRCRAARSKHGWRWRIRQMVSCSAKPIRPT